MGNNFKLPPLVEKTSVEWWFKSAKAGFISNETRFDDWGKFK